MRELGIDVSRPPPPPPLPSPVALTNGHASARPNCRLLLSCMGTARPAAALVLLARLCCNPAPHACCAEVVPCQLMSMRGHGVTCVMFFGKCPSCLVAAQHGEQP